MVAKVKTLTFLGIEVVDVDVQVKIADGMPGFTIVGLADKAVGESKERVRAAISSIGLALPAKKITVNLAPADLLKEGSHFDLAIALGLLIEMGVIKQDMVDGYYCIGELALDGAIARIGGALPAAIGANSKNCGLICPESCGTEAAWAGDMSILAPPNLVVLLNHFKGIQLLSRPKIAPGVNRVHYPDLQEIKGQENAKRALEIAAAGGHNMLMVGPPGTGKSMLASRLPGIIPELDGEEILEVNMIHSIYGSVIENGLITNRPFRDPHHSCSMPAMVGGGAKAKPGEISLAHNGILFLDELAEFPRLVLDSMRQPLENGSVTISRANFHLNYPASFQLIAAMNPCRCGYLMDDAKACKKAPLCGEQYQSKISGPMLDRMDLIVTVPQVDIFNHENIKPGENSATVAARVKKARAIQNSRYNSGGNVKKSFLTNAKASIKAIENYIVLDKESQEIVKKTIERNSMSMRGYSRLLRVARTIADLEHSENIHKHHVLEAISYRRMGNF